MHNYTSTTNSSLHSESGRLSECVEILEYLWDVDPTHLLGHAQLGTCHMKMKNYEEAGKVFSEVLAVDGEHKMTLQNYGKYGLTVGPPDTNGAEESAHC